MTYLLVFAVIAILEVVSAVLVFAFKDIVHTVLALSLLFVFNSAMFLVLGQPLLALLQLFIMVGGVSTYIFVGVASSTYSEFKATSYKTLVIASIAIFALFSYESLNSTKIIAGQNILTKQMIQTSIASNIGLFYLIAVMLFGAGMGSIILIKRMGSK